MKEITLRNQLEENKALYLEHFGCLNWQWTDEGIPNTILDYYGSKGSVQNFTEDDWAAVSEYGWTRAEVEDLCRDEESSEV